MTSAFHLKSDTIPKVTYSLTTCRLEVWFKDRGPYTHSRVPERVAMGLINAGSPGRYYRQNLKGRYPR